MLRSPLGPLRLKKQKVGQREELKEIQRSSCPSSALFITTHPPTVTPLSVLEHSILSLAHFGIPIRGVKEGCCGALTVRRLDVQLSES